MNVLKKNISLVVIILLLCIIPINVKAIPGCCSWHGGEAGCSGGQTLCADGTVSSCPCDGTNSSIHGNSSNSNSQTQSEPVSIWVYIIGFGVFWGGLYLFTHFIEFGEKVSANNKENKRRKRQIEEKQREEELKEQKENDIESIIKSDSENSISVEEIDDELIRRFTSDDLLKIINSNSDDIFYLIDEVNAKKNGYTEREIFDNLCIKILENQKLTPLHNKCIKYLLEKKLINNYETIFVIMLQNKHISLAKYVMNNCNDIKFNFSKHCYLNGEYKSYTEFIFESLLEINDLSLAEKIALKENLSLYLSTSFFENTYDKNDEYKYQLLSVLEKNEKYFHIDIESIFERKINNCNDDEAIIKVIDFYSKINCVLEEKGYYLVFLFIKNQNINCLQYILDTYKHINLDKCIEDNLNDKINGFTPLTYACHRKSSAIVEMLLDYGANGDFPDKYGDTPLAYACYLKNTKLIKMLYERGYRFKNSSDNESLESYMKEKKTYLLPYVYVHKLYKSKKK